MTDGHAGGASADWNDAHDALRDLVMAATVRIHRTGVGYAVDEPGSFLGSGFFIAPNWVLTCAHVAHGGEGGDIAVVYESRTDEGPSAVPGEVVATLPDRLAPLGSGNWPAPDLALVKLREPVDHECVYVSERPTAYYGRGSVFYAGWTVLGEELQVLDGVLTVEGTIGGRSASTQLRLGGNDVPHGVSGGPLIDPVRGEVIGVLKSRTTHRAGGTSTGIEQLRRLRVPEEAVRTEDDDLYHAVFHAHDRYHRDRQRQSDSGRDTWADVQSRLRARPGRTLSPGERTQLLGRLADLPPPVSTGSLLDILGSLPEAGALTRLQPAPRAWRDGLGALYESSRDDSARELLLDYAMRVMSAQPPHPTASPQDAAEQALWEWVRQAAEDLSTGYRNNLKRRREDRLRTRRLPGVAPAEHARTPAVDPARRPSALLELEQRGWARDSCDWRLSVVRSDGEVTRLPEAEGTPLPELPAKIAVHLEEAFRQCDEPGSPGVLQVALPYALLDLAVDEWRLRPGEPTLGAQRPVVVRCADHDRLPAEGGRDAFGAERDEADEEAGARWRWLHARPVVAEILDCDDGVRSPVPTVAGLRRLSPDTVPVLCRFGDDPSDDDAIARIVLGGFGVALWRRRQGRPGAVCGPFHRGAKGTVAGMSTAGSLPGLVHDLRVRLNARRAEAYWANGIVLLYDDPHHPLPGTGDLLEAP
ncbi:serine protease [Streptomyces sp. NBC_00444]|uniref:VMAP-C domain-containing protein n=1 Tax=Streptomyces sp. NBC_00444 TaxID=2975744 RepID=UPI002E1EB3CE